MNEPRRDFIEKTQKMWSKYYHRKLSNQEAIKINQNILKLIELLKDLDQN